MPTLTSPTHPHNKKESWCAGVFVGNKFVLTAAHYNGRSINVILGAHNIEKKEETQQYFLVKRAIPHPDYSHKNFSKDIILLQLKRSIKQTGTVKPLQLPRYKNRLRPGQKYTVAGWGKVALRGTYSDILQEVQLTLQKEGSEKTTYTIITTGPCSCAWGNQQEIQSPENGPGTQVPGIAGTIPTVPPASWKSASDIMAASPP
ncbi:hypothetical protein QTO34_019393 [Cnephaeus nilssonii]|uniref:Peptidase S1 domain-containing protein n=1 Tax=Cnephaeus nilssonii TaxID=3371016 RepID=A0AA40HXF1_CNENI|nr:hypothetical protein QTO34_019393 [Eptesicus nilssonii]